MDHHDHDEEQTRDRKRLLAALGLTALLMGVEAVGGWLSGSLALLSDAGHMLTDSAALLLAALASVFSGRPADLRRTWGFVRLEVLSALFNGLLLIGIAGLIAYEGVHRLRDPQPLKAGLMLAVAVAGLAVNLAGMALLARSRSMNVRGAFLHVVGDAISSVGVIAAGLIVWITGWTLADPIVSLLIAGLIAAGAASLIRDAVHVLLEAVPSHIDLKAVLSAMKGLDGVCGVHDLHVWTIGHDRHALSAHLVCPDRGTDRDRILGAAQEVLRERFGITHTTLQVESAEYGKGAPGDGR